MQQEDRLAAIHATLNRIELNLYTTIKQTQ